MAKDLPVAARSATSNQQSAIPDAFSRRVAVERIEPEIDGGRFPIKRTVGETVDVEATIFADGHDVIAAVLRDRATTVDLEEPVHSGRLYDRWHQSVVASQADTAESAVDRHDGW